MNNQLEKSKLNREEMDIAPKVFGFAALGVMAAMFALMGFHMTIVIFLVLVGYFVWRAVARTEIGEVRGIFEFYLQANEVLRDDERRWYGFEIQDVIYKGQRILGMMKDPPPLVHFALGALHHRAGNFKQAQDHFAFLVEDENADEKNRVTASSELRSYVRILRKLEREPAEAPQTTAAIRALERARRHRAQILLQESRVKVQESLAAAKAKEITNAPIKPQPFKPLLERLEEPKPQSETAITESSKTAAATATIGGNGDSTANAQPKTTEAPANNGDSRAKSEQPKKPAKANNKSHRSISEVLRDIYD